ncbi:MAG: hypothetical protein J1E65_07300 [Lachnospiraceae bacterium]|nr:hypothetical protein [Lachnospiraceae bacterium]
MSETYVECLVNREPSLIGRLVKTVFIMMTVVFVLLGFLGVVFIVPFIFAIATGVAAYFVHLNTYIEYEYLYLDKELSVDKIKAQTRRKKVATFEVERIEILAPIKSYHLDNYKNRNVKVTDYSIGREEQPDTRYVMYYDGNQQIILSPNEALIKAIRNVSPRKVFLD